MVFMKVSDGYKTRKLQISPKTTYVQLREQVHKLAQNGYIRCCPAQEEGKGGIRDVKLTVVLDLC